MKTSVNYRAAIKLWTLNAEKSRQAASLIRFDKSPLQQIFSFCFLVPCTFRMILFIIFIEVSFLPSNKSKFLSCKKTSTFEMNVPLCFKIGEVIVMNTYDAFSWQHSFLDDDQALFQVCSTKPPRSSLQSWFSR